MKSLAVMALAVVVAIGSFAYGRYRHVDETSVVLSNPFNSDNRARVSNPFADTSLTGSWIKEQWIFTMLIPGAALAAGVFLAVRK
jgi:hypothetical protein